MKSEQASRVTKISYEKPTAVDLGPAAPVVGASCAPGDEFEITDTCIAVGNSAAGPCSLTGNSPGDWCQNGVGYANEG